MIVCKGRGSKFEASELNLCKKSMGRRPSCRSFLLKFNCKRFHVQFGKYRRFRLCFVTQSVYLKKRKRKTSFYFAKDRICFMFFITFNGRLCVNLTIKANLISALCFYGCVKPARHFKKNQESLSFFLSKLKFSPLSLLLLRTCSV